MNPGQAPPAMRPGAGRNGPTYGQQAIATWEAGDTAPARTMVLDTIAGDSLWLVQVDGPVFVDVEWGTSATKNLFSLQAPARFTVPGRCQVNVRPTAAAPLAARVICRASLVPVWGGVGSQDLRRLVTSAAPTPIQDEAAAFFALTACALTIGGVAVAVAAGVRVPLIAGSTHDAGTGYLEFSP